MSAPTAFADRTQGRASGLTRILQVALAVLAGAFVAAPVLPDGASMGTSTFALIAGAAVVVLLARDSQASAGKAVVGVAVAVVGTLILLSVAFGFAASDVAAFAVVPAVLAAALVYGAARALTH